MKPIVRKEPSLVFFRCGDKDPRPSMPLAKFHEHSKRFHSLSFSEYTLGSWLPLGTIGSWHCLKANEALFYLTDVAVENDGIEAKDLSKFLVLCTLTPEKAKKYKCVIRGRFENCGTATYEGPVYSVDQPRSAFTSRQTFGFIFDDNTMDLETISFQIDHA